MKEDTSGLVSVPLWDLPVRLFHWLLVLGIACSWLTAELGYMRIHYISGLCIIVLLTFRLLWGCIGSPVARFQHFVKGFGHMHAYMRGLTKRSPSYTIGHNPVAGLAVLLLLLFVALQAASGLFASDDIAFDGPLFDNVPKEVAHMLGSYHELNFNFLLGLIVVHLLAQSFYFFWKKENLVRAMADGYAKVPARVAMEAERKGELRRQKLVYALICLLPGLVLASVIYWGN